MVYSSIPPCFVLSGWAKFTAADPSKGAWDGWVSLRDTNFGVCYGAASDASGLACKGDGAMNNILSGWAWGSDVGGWLNFGVLIPPVLKDPIISASDGKSATLSWTNGMDYSRVEIYRSSPETDINCKDPNKLADSHQCKYIKTNPTFLVSDPLSKSASGFDKSARVDGLESGTTYGFLVRAYP